MKVIRIGICTLIVLAVLTFGGVDAWGQATLEVGTAILLVFWGALVIRRRRLELRWNWLYLPLLGLGLVASMQLALGLSVYPYLTKIELLKWASCVLLVFLMMESFETGDHVRQFVWFLLSLSFVVALFGIVQHFTSNGKLYWLVSVPPGAGPFGPFVDGDHFAGFMELTIPFGLALLLFRSWRREQLTVLLLFTIVPVGALILTASRGGIIGLFFEIALLVFLSRRQQIGRRPLLTAAAILLATASFVAWLGVNRAIERFQQLAGEGISQELRVSIYHDTGRIILDHPWIGTGLGTLATVFPRYASFYNGLTVDHAHNDYLELLADTGIAGGLCGLSFFVLLFWQGFTSFKSQRTPFSCAAIAGALTCCAGLLLHGLVDFNFHIPSNGLIFLLLSCIATAGWREVSRFRHVPLGAQSSQPDLPFPASVTHSL